MAKTPRNPSPARSADESRICVGKIGAAHGVRGEVRLWSYTADPLAIADYAPLESADGKHVLSIETLRPQGESIVARFDGVKDRNAAEALRNIELYVPRDRLPEIEEDDEFYIADLVGLQATDKSGKALGEVVGVHNFGAGDLIEIKLIDASDTVLLSFSNTVVPEVDIAGGKVVIEMPNEISPPENAPKEEG
jgi:16S rRNA processing protein RimM